MKKRLIQLGLIMTVATPIVAMSCSTTQKENVSLGKHAYLYSKEIQDSSTNKRVDLQEVERNDIRKVPSNLAAHFGSKMISGGFGEQRKFYQTPNVYHTGIDAFVPEGTQIHSPGDGEIITAVWRHSSQHTNLALGSGGNITLKVKIDSLPIEENLKQLIYLKERKHQVSALAKYPNGYYDKDIYYAVPKVMFADSGSYQEPQTFRFEDGGDSYNEISVSDKDHYDQFMNTYKPSSSLGATKEQVIDDSHYLIFTLMHTSKRTVTQLGKYTVGKGAFEGSLSNDQTYQEHKGIPVKAGDVVGQVGNPDENGGWATHTHVGVYSPSISMWSHITSDRLHGKYPIFGMGTYSSVGGSNKDPMTGFHGFKNFAIIHGIINPNNIFHFYNEKTKIEKDIL